MNVAVILPAAGRSTRFGSGTNKLLERLGGHTVLARSIGAMRSHHRCGDVFIASDDPDVIAHVRSLAIRDLHICPGGATRAHSVLSALRQVPATYEWVAVHDAARPCVAPELIDRTLAAARDHGAAVPAMPLTATIKQTTGPLPAPARQTLPRHELWAAQTPQVMRRATLLHAFESCPIPLDQVTDDAQLLELLGLEVWLVPGDERNIKITTPLDLKLAEFYLNLMAAR